jgi:uncharacterized protein (TIGR03000 family)
MRVVALVSSAVLLSTLQPVGAQVLSKWGHPVITLGLAPYDTVDPGQANYPGGPGFKPGYGYYPGPGPGTYPWMDGPGTPFDRRKIVSTFPNPSWFDGGLTLREENEPLPPGAALLMVKLPAEAELWFDEVKTSQGGNDRRFLTPPLPSGRRLEYTLRVRWQICDAELTRVEKVEVVPGGRFTVNFLTANSWTGRRIEMLPRPTKVPKE